MTLCCAEGLFRLFLMDIFGQRQKVYDMSAEEDSEEVTALGGAGEAFSEATNHSRASNIFYLFHLSVYRESGFLRYTHERY